MLKAAGLVAFVGSCDLDRSDRFYRGLLGLERIEATPFANAYDAHGTMLRVTRVEAVVRDSYTVLGWAVTDIDEAVASLSARGLAFRRYEPLTHDAAGIWSAPGGARVAWFEDPDGNTLSLSQFSATAQSRAPGGNT